MPEPEDPIIKEYKLFNAQRWKERTSYLHRSALMESFSLIVNRNAIHIKIIISPQMYSPHYYCTVTTVPDMYECIWCDYFLSLSGVVFQRRKVMRNRNHLQVSLVLSSIKTSGIQYRYQREWIINLDYLGRRYSGLWISMSGRSSIGPHKKHVLVMVKGLWLRQP